MLDKNGKKIKKADAKRVLCRVIANHCYMNNFKSLKLDKVFEVMKEYGFSRKSIHDTIICNYRPSENTAQFYATVHNFCFTVLQNQ